jgi:hypothetical protein
VRADFEVREPRPERVTLGVFIYLFIIKVEATIPGEVWASFVNLVKGQTDSDIMAIVKPSFSIFWLFKHLCFPALFFL